MSEPRALFENRARYQFILNTNVFTFRIFIQPTRSNDNIPFKLGLKQEQKLSKKHDAKSQIHTHTR